MHLDDALLQDYIAGFYGYGNYQGRYWLVGMEEGGGDSVAEITSRLNAWEKRGKPELDDVAGFHRETGLDRWFRPNPPLQPTWAKLIRLLLCAQGRSMSVEAVRAFQGGTLGRAGGTNCILELLPLPSPSSSHWLYAACSSLPYLRDRELYRRHVAPLRVRHLQQRIRDHQPEVVVFYGLGYRDWWEQVAGTRFSTTPLDRFYLSQTGHTIFAVTKHPTFTGITNRYFEAAGALVHARGSQAGA